MITVPKRYFHGLPDTIGSRLGEWRVVQRTFEQQHIVRHNRQLLYSFTTHVHPLAERLTQELVQHDIRGTEDFDTEKATRRAFFGAAYRPTLLVKDIEAPPNAKAVAVLARPTSKQPLADDGLPIVDLDFDYASGAYAVYNWELFFHVPFTIALQLSRSGRYAEAQRWFHYIFDPTDSSDPRLGPKRFWKVRPFRIDEVEHIETTLYNLATGDDPVLRDATARAIGAWRDSPFRPHLIARTRPTAYMYATVMAYLDNLIEWGDSLFRQDTRESINEAMQLYVLAANILGPKPQPVPKRGSAKKQTYASLRSQLDEFGNAAVKIEAEIGFDLYPPAQPVTPKPEHVVLESIGRSLYFCVPRNDKLIGYWDTVADRLFKIRNSLNLQGIFRQLPLFAPPIDPALLARAVAAGVDVGAIVAGLEAPVAPVRSGYLLQKALEMAQEVKSLGSQLLAALEKKDNEALGVLRARHEVKLLELTERVKYAQWQEAIKNHETTQKSFATAAVRYAYYERLLGHSAFQLPELAAIDVEALANYSLRVDEPVVSGREIKVDIDKGGTALAEGARLSRHETKEIRKLADAQSSQLAAGSNEKLASYMNIIPSFSVNLEPLGIGASVSFGGSNIAAIFSAMAASDRADAGEATYQANKIAKTGSYTRRDQEWALQSNLAAAELTGLYKQLRASELREYIAKSEYENHKKQIEQSNDVLEFLTNEKNLRSGDKRKTTTEDFYLWMKREAQGLHSRCFQFAYELAKKAERAVQFELGNRGAHFIDGAYLAGKEGLLAGEKLYLDLKRMEVAYAEQNKRELELTKHISLKEWFPLELIKLRSTGSCTIKLDEALYDLDCPGHSYRRIKSLALSLPCVTGPHASVNCSVTLKNGSMRTKDGLNAWDVPATDTIVTSSAQADAGLFEANLRDERYLPFEGAGAVAEEVTLALLGKPRPFDYETIADAVLTVRYTARSEGNGSGNDVEKWLGSHATRLFAIRHEFASEWAAFKGDSSASPTLKFSLTDEHFPFRLSNVTNKAQRLHVFCRGGGVGKVRLKRNGITVGNPEDLDTGEAVITAPFERSGKFELTFDSNAFDDVLLVFDWASADA